MSLAQQCEYAWCIKLSESLSDSDRLRLSANSGPTQTWVTALPLSWKNWNLNSQEWLIAARRRLGLDVRTKRTRCSNCRFHEIGLKGDHALQCSGKVGTKMRHDALKVLLARAFKQAGFGIKMEQSGGLLDGRRPGDVEVEDWVVINNWRENKSLSIDVAIIDPTADHHSAKLRSDGVGAAATKYEDRKRKTYWDMKGEFSPFILEAQGGFGIEAKRLVRELERRRKEKECVPNMRNFESYYQPLGEISLVTAIGFELVRRNVRMILDRSPEEEPLIPAEKTRIRLEIARNKEKVTRGTTGAYEHEPVMNGDLSATDPLDFGNLIRPDPLLQIQGQKVGRKDHNRCSEMGAGISSDLVNSGHKRYRKINIDLEKSEGPSKVASSHLMSEIPDLPKDRMSLIMKTGKISQWSAEINQTRGKCMWEPEREKDQPLPVNPDFKQSKIMADEVGEGDAILTIKNKSAPHPLEDHSMRETEPTGITVHGTEKHRILSEEAEVTDNSKQDPDKSILEVNFGEFNPGHELRKKLLSLENDEFNGRSFETTTRSSPRQAEVFASTTGMASASVNFKLLDLEPLPIPRGCRRAKSRSVLNARTTLLAESTSKLGKQGSLPQLLPSTKQPWTPSSLLRPAIAGLLVLGETLSLSSKNSAC